jgi:isocitrate dehydrogenase kinase/phosphatase
MASAFQRALDAMRCAQRVVEGFLSYDARFRALTRRAPQRFASRDWAGAHRDAVERIDLYELCLRETLAELSVMLRAEERDPAFWAEVKRHFANLIDGLPDNEFCKTFFSSVSRQLFRTVGIAPEIEFVATDLDPLARANPESATRLLRNDAGLAALVRRLPGMDLERNAETVVAAILRWSDSQPEPVAIDSIQIIDAEFYQGSRAYLIGRINAGLRHAPLAIALRNTGEGIGVDAVMLSDDELSILLGFARSYFHVDLERVADTVAFLKELLPRKPTGELFTVLGRAKQGKTERYRSLIRHLEASRDQFVHAPGQRGLVMVCFTLPSLDLVFKVIGDRIPQMKNVSRQDVEAKYGFVFRHDRAGRLIDAQEFRRLRFPRARFAPALLQELRDEAASSVREEQEDLIFDHLYIERRLVPLDLYLTSAEPAAALRAALDYGQAIRDLACTDVFPGDLLLKNFGVTRHGRVIFYDYDELCRVTDCQFRDLPASRYEEDEMEAEPWFFVGDRDVFPETFGSFLGLSAAQRTAFMARHGELLGAAYWRQTQQRLQAGEVLEVLPYLSSGAMLSQS